MPPVSSVVSLDELEQIAAERQKAGLPPLTLAWVERSDGSILIGEDEWGDEEAPSGSSPASAPSALKK
jgi:hypothetical protein